MKQLVYKKWIRFIAGILCILTANTLVISIVGMVFCESLDVYSGDMSASRRSIYKEASQNYSIWAASEYTQDFAMDELEDTRFCYGVIQTDNIEKLDLNDRKIYEVCNFEKGKKITLDNPDIFVYSCDLGTGTEIFFENSLWNHSYIFNHGYAGEGSLEAHVVDAIYYTSDTGDFYYYVEDINTFFPFLTEVHTSEDGAVIGDLLEVKKGTVDSGVVQYNWKDGTKRICIDNNERRYLADISIVRYKELREIGNVNLGYTEDSNYSEYSYRDGSILLNYVSEETENATKPYFIISYAKEPLNEEGELHGDTFFEAVNHWQTLDYFSQADEVLAMAYSIDYDVYIIFAVSMIIMLLSFVVCVMGAGHQSGESVVREGWLERIPFDVFTILVICIEFIPIYIVAVCLNESMRCTTIFFAVVALLLSEVIAFAYLLSFIVRVKCKTCLKNTWCYRILCWSKRIICRVFAMFAGFWKEVSKSFSLCAKAWMIMAAIAFCEFIGIVGFSYETDVMLILWFLEKLVLYGIITLVLMQMQKLKEGAARLADGSMDTEVDTQKMFWEFKKHGENLNSIKDGIHLAVEERMKSERFKTELITNVSHDIKTPLTSITNYVDLLEKEDIDHPKIVEYLEVLSRQSTRLKKLIEDLMEASKASTGNLPVEWESIDAKVLVLQTVGEFEEKLQVNQIELIVQGSKQEIRIAADTRHLFRIFENLMNNICKYALERTRAYVNIEQQNHDCIITFRNISRYQLNVASDELMERFVRGDSSRNTEGSGLGLSIAKSLTELMNGTFEIVVDGDLFKIVLKFPVTQKI